MTKEEWNGLAKGTILQYHDYHAGFQLSGELIDTKTEYDMSDSRAWRIRVLTCSNLSQYSVGSETWDSATHSDKWVIVSIPDIPITALTKRTDRLSNIDED